ncbi:MAG: hypothetical protein OXJ62_14975 [Spirochaetaceae bacterium]|nr:hypothetical protein [Spirochaetaceae bacterium]
MSDADRERIRLAWQGDTMTVARVAALLGLPMAVVHLHLYGPAGRR